MRAKEVLYTVFLDHNASSLSNVSLAPSEGELRERKTLTTSKKAYTIIKDMTVPTETDKLGHQIFYDFSFIDHYFEKGVDALIVRKADYPEAYLDHEDIVVIEFYLT